MLRVHEGRLFWIDAKKARIEQVGASDDAGRRYIVGVVYQGSRNAGRGQLVIGEYCDRFVA